MDRRQLAQLQANILGAADGLNQTNIVEKIKILADSTAVLAGGTVELLDELNKMFINLQEKFAEVEDRLALLENPEKLN